VADRSVGKPAIWIDELTIGVEIKLVAFRVVRVVKEDAVCLGNGVADEVLGKRHYGRAGHLRCRVDAMKGGVPSRVDVTSGESCSHS